MSERKKGIFLATVGSSFWALSGVFAQMLFERVSVSPEWLVSTRLLFSGIILVIYSYFKEGTGIFNIFKDRRDLVDLLLFGLVGLLGVQLTYFKAVFYSGTAIATVLQFTGPVFILLYLVLSGERSLDAREFLLILVASAGVALLVTGGRFSSEGLSLPGSLYGLLAALLFSFYSLIQKNIMKKYSSSVIAGWGMLMAGIIFQFIDPVTGPGAVLDSVSLLLVTGVVILGTVLSFLFYLTSLRYINPALASVLTAFEPVLAVVLSVPIFGRVFGFIEMLALTMIILSVVILSLIDGNKAVHNE